MQRIFRATIINKCLIMMKIKLPCKITIAMCVSEFDYKKLKKRILYVSMDGWMKAEGGWFISVHHHPSFLRIKSHCTNRTSFINAVSTAVTTTTFKVTHRHKRISSNNIITLHYNTNYRCWYCKQSDIPTDSLSPKL